MKTISLANGTTQANMDVSRLAKGYYLVTLNGGSVSTETFSPQ